MSGEMAKIFSCIEEYRNRFYLNEEFSPEKFIALVEWWENILSLAVEYIGDFNVLVEIYKNLPPDYNQDEYKQYQNMIFGNAVLCATNYNDLVIFIDENNPNILNAIIERGGEIKGLPDIQYAIMKELGYV